MFFLVSLDIVECPNITLPLLDVVAAPQQLPVGGPVV